MAKKKVKKYHKGGSHEDHHVQAVPAPIQNPVGGPGGLPVGRNRSKTELVEEKRIINKVNQKKADRVPAYPLPRQRPTNPFMPAPRTQPITVGGPRQVQPMPTTRPTVVGVTPQPVYRQTNPPFLRDLLGNLVNSGNRRRKTASRVNPNAILGRPTRRRRR